MARKTQDRAQSTSATLPEFDAPPLFETVFGVRFPTLKGWDVRHFGLFWDQVRADYPKFEVKPPLQGPGPHRGLGAEGIVVQLVTEPQLRCWYLVEDGTRLLQIQHDGFFHNWRKVTLEEVYPRYATIRPALEREWSRFHTFLAAQGIDSPEVVECEATYINHFEKGREWSSTADLPKVLKWWGTASPALEFTRLALNASVQAGEHTLDLVLAPAVRRNDKHEIVQLNLTVKGRPASSETSDVMEWMDSARAAIVRGFTDLTTDGMHALWRRTS